MIVFSILFVIRTIAGMDHDSPYIDSSDNEISEPRVHNRITVKAECGSVPQFSVRLHHQYVPESNFEPILLVRAPISPILSIVIQSELYKVVENENTVFRWGWSYSWKTESVPTSEPWIEDEGVFIAQPYVQRHICHFAESLGSCADEADGPLAVSSVLPAISPYLPIHSRI